MSAASALTPQDPALARLVDQIQTARAQRSPLQLRGGGSKDFYGGEPIGEPLEVAPLAGISSYEPSELVVTVRAGTPLAELEAALTEVFKSQPRDYWLSRLLAEDVPSAPIYTLDEALADPQVQHLGMVKELDHPKVGKIKLLGGAVTFSDTPAEILTPAPTHGQHTDEVLAKYGITTGKAAQ